MNSLHKDTVQRNRLCSITTCQKQRNTCLLFENMYFYCTYLIKTKILSCWVLGTFWKSQKLVPANTKNHQNAKISCHMVYYAACYTGNCSRILFQTKLQRCSQILNAKIVNEFSLSGKWAELIMSPFYWLEFSFQVKQIKRMEWSKWRQSPTAACLKTNSFLSYTKMQLQCVRWDLTELLQRANLYSTLKESSL